MIIFWRLLCDYILYDTTILHSERKWTLASRSSQSGFDHTSRLNKLYSSHKPDFWLMAHNGLFCAIFVALYDGCCTNDFSAIIGRSWPSLLAVHRCSSGLEARVSSWNISFLLLTSSELKHIYRSTTTCSITASAPGHIWWMKSKLYVNYTYQWCGIIVTGLGRVVYKLLWYLINHKLLGCAIHSWKTILWLFVYLKIQFN